MDFSVIVAKIIIVVVITALIFVLIANVGASPYARHQDSLVQDFVNGLKVLSMLAAVALPVLWAIWILFK